MPIIIPKSTFSCIILLVLVATSGCWRSQSEKADNSEKNTTESVIPVRVTTVKTGPISHYVEASSTIEAKYYVDVYPEIGGEVIAVYFEEGDRVNKGDLLCALEHSAQDISVQDAKLRLEELRYQFERQKLYLQEAKQQQTAERINIQELKERRNSAHNKLRLAENDLQRAQAMFARDLISKELHESKQFAYRDADSAFKAAQLVLHRSQVTTAIQQSNIARAKIELKILNNNIGTAKLNIAKAELELAKSKIEAPISGVISQHDIQVGQFILPSQRIFSIVDPYHLEIDIGIPEKELLQIRKNQQVRIFSQVLPPSASSVPQGIVKIISPIVQKESGTIKVTIAIIGKYLFSIPFEGLQLASEVASSTLYRKFISKHPLSPEATLQVQEADSLWLLSDKSRRCDYLLAKNNQQVQVYARQHQSLFRPGMFVSIEILTQTHKKAVLISKKALLFDDNVPIVFVLEKNRARKIFLYDHIVGFKDKFHYEVLDKIYPGNFIITVGQAGLKDNALVRVVK